MPEHCRETANCVFNYEEAAASGQLPDLAMLVAGVSPANRLRALAELVLVDSKRRRQRGQTKALEDYLCEFPELRGHEDLFVLPLETINKCPGDVLRQTPAPADRSRQANRLEGGGLHIRCPHCHNPIEVVDTDPLTDISLPRVWQQLQSH